MDITKGTIEVADVVEVGVKVWAEGVVEPVAEDAPETGTMIAMGITDVKITNDQTVGMAETRIVTHAKNSAHPLVEAVITITVRRAIKCQVIIESKFSKKN